MSGDKRSMKRVKAGTSKSGAAHRRAKFVEAFIANGGNATQAAIKAGFSVKRARATGAELVADRNIMAEIEKRRATVLAEAEVETGVTTEMVLRELGRLVRVDPRRFFAADGSLKPIADLDDECAAALASVEVDELFKGRGEQRLLAGYVKKVKFWDKNSAIEKAMKHLGLFEKDNKQRPLSPPLEIRFV